MKYTLLAKTEGRKPFVLAYKSDVNVLVYPVQSVEAGAILENRGNGFQRVSIEQRYGVHIADPNSVSDKEWVVFDSKKQFEKFLEEHT